MKQSPRTVTPGNTAQTNRENSKNQGQAIENNNGSRLKNENKPPSPLQNKSNQKQCNAPGRKKPPRSQQRKN